MSDLPENIRRALLRPPTQRVPFQPLIRYDNQPTPQVPDAKPKQHETEQPVAAVGREETSMDCPIVRFTLCRVRLLDVDAKYASIKDLLDGLAIAGLICGDKEGQVRLEVEQTKVRHFKDEETLIQIEL